MRIARHAAAFGWRARRRPEAWKAQKRGEWWHTASPTRLSSFTSASVGFPSPATAFYAATQWSGQSPIFRALPRIPPAGVVNPAVAIH